MNLKNLGPTEVIIIVLILVVIFGGKKFNSMARSLGESTKEAKKVKDEIDSLKKEVSSPSQKEDTSTG